MQIDRISCADYGIITDGSKGLEFAKAELEKFIRKACGFSILAYTNQAHFISLGVNEKSASLIEEYGVSDLNEDGFYIVPKNGNVYIFGQSEKSVIFGVYEFLELYLGVRFISRDCEYVPVSEKLIVEEKTVKRVPISGQRTYLCSSAYEDALVNLRYKYTADYCPEAEAYGLRSKWYKGIPSSHNSNLYVPYEKYKDTHPEFFSVYQYKGFRLFDAVELCYTNGLTEDGEYDESVDCSVISVTVDSLMKYIADDPEAKYFMFGRVDNSNARCHCPKCEKARAEYGDSGIMMVFMNNVIAQARKRFAEQGKTFDKKLVTFAYSATVNPPVKDGKPISPKVIPDKDLHIRYAPLDAANYTYAFDDPRQNECIRTQIEGWSALTKNIMLWDYNCCFFDYFLYFANLSYLKRNLQLCERIGMSYIMKQGAYNIGTVWQDELKSYVCSKLFWNTALDVEEIVKEYVSIYFGLGAEEVLAFIQRMESFFAEKIARGFHLSLGETKAGFFNPKEYPLEFLQEMEALLDGAIQKVQTSALSAEEKAVFVKRLQTVLITPVRMILRNAEAYFGGENIAYEEKFYALADAIGVKRQGEVVPIFIDFVSDNQSKYKLITGQSPTQEELRAAEYIQRCVFEKTGFTVPIEKDNAIYPAYWERGIMVGKNAITKEFYKEGLDLSGYAYFADVKGWCVFLDSDYNVMDAAKVFVEEYLRTGEKENALEIVVKKRVGKLKK